MNEEHPLYWTWCNMKYRCSNPNRPDYKRYGALGITVCDEWENDFWQFVNDMGDRPEGYTLDRIDSTGNYEPSNCRWATYQEQSENKRNNIWITLPDGYQYQLTELARTHGKDRSSLHSQYMRYGEEGVLRSLGYIEKKRKTTLFPINGKSQSLSAWCKEFNLNFGTWKSRLRRKGYEFTYAALKTELGA